MARYKWSRERRDREAARKRGQRAKNKALAQGKSPEEAEALAQAARERGALPTTGGGSGAGRKQAAHTLPQVLPSAAPNTPQDALTGIASVRAKLYAMCDQAQTASEMSAAVGALMKLPAERELGEPAYVRHLREQAQRCDDYIAIISAAQSIGVTEAELHATEDTPLITAARALLSATQPESGAPEEEALEV